MRQQKSKKKILMVVTAVAALAAIALWQFYVFATFRNAEGIVDVQGGSIHLWSAIILGLTACIGAILGASFFLRYDRNNEMHITSPPAARESVL
jgi:amino acid permease